MSARRNVGQPKWIRVPLSKVELERLIGKLRQGSAPGDNDRTLAIRLGVYLEELGKKEELREDG